MRVNLVPAHAGTMAAMDGWIRCHIARLLTTVLTSWAAASMAAAPTAWFDGARPTAQAQQALALLADAASHGLDPRDYGVEPLVRAVTALSAGTAPGTDASRLEAALDAAMRRYASDLHDGRVDPRAIHPGFAMPPRTPFDASAWLAAALAASRLPEAARELAPPLLQYERLRQALAQQHRLVGHAAWQQPLPALPGTRGSRIGKLEPGQPYEGLGVLAQRLVALGDLGEAEPEPALYDGAVVEAVQQFQTRHGLSPDGVVGAATFARLQLDPSVGVRQLELALERLRWTPLLHSRRMVTINLPEFVLRAYEVHDGRIELAATMKVIVGKALDTRTPLIAADMRHIEFSPYWNVPPSIVRKEIVPKLRRDPGYFAREGFEFVGPGGQVQTTLTPASIDALRAGAIRIRQRPGPRNALGDIKFVFPNHEAIYLHHTPSIRLFERDRRDFSHGCIRVEDPVALARFVLRDQPEWTGERILAAMAKRESATLRLDEPVRVLIAYGTALVKDGRTWFFDDIYGQDRLLDAALRQHSQQLPPILD